MHDQSRENTPTGPLAELLKALCAIYSKTLSPELYQAWEFALRGIPTEAIGRACHSFASELDTEGKRRPFPIPAEIRARAQAALGDSPTGLRMGERELLERADRRETKRLHDAGIPYVLVRGTHPDSLMPFKFSQKAREDYWRVCSRRDEWVDSNTAQGPIPPCIATWTLGLVNCEDPILQECTMAIFALNMNTPGGKAVKRLQDPI